MLYDFNKKTACAKEIASTDCTAYNNDDKLNVAMMKC